MLKKIIVGAVGLAILVIAREAVSNYCGRGCTNDPVKIARGCPACPLQEPAAKVGMQHECVNCGKGTRDFFHDDVYTISENY